MLTPKMTEALEYIDAYGSAGVIHRRTLAALVSRGLIEQVGNKAAIAAGAAWHYRVTPAGNTVYSEVNRRHLGGRFTSQPDTPDTPDQPNTPISYLVIDNDPNSPECETVYEVLGTMLDGPTGLNTHVYLRSLVTDTVSRMWASEFQAYDFRALPLDQVSQDRKDARDIEAAHAEALWMNLSEGNRLLSDLADRFPQASRTGDQFKPLDTTAKQLASADARSDLGDKVAATKRTQISTPLADFGRDFPNVEKALTEPRRPAPNPMAFPQRTAPGTFNITLPKVSDREPVRDYLVRYVLVGEVDGLGESCEHCTLFDRKINCNVYVTPNSPGADTYAQCCEECALHVVDGVLDTDPAHVVTIERAV